MITCEDKAFPYAYSDSSTLVSKLGGGHWHINFDAGIDGKVRGLFNFSMPNSHAHPSVVTSCMIWEVVQFPER